MEAESLTWAGLEARAQVIAAALAAEAAPGERALLLYPPGLEFVAAFFGCLRAGVVAVPAYPPRPRKDQPRLRAIVRDAEPRLALTTAELLPGLEKLAAADPGLAGVRWLATDHLPAAEWDGADPDPATDPEAIAFLQYTSGSTSTPKGVMVTHANLVHNERLMSAAFEMDEESVVVGWLPLYHDMGLIGNVLQPLWCGGRCILMSPVAFLQRPRRWLEAVARYQATTSGGPNFSYDLCVRKVGPEEREGLDLSSWRVAYNGAEPVRAETLERFAAAFAPAGFRREAFYPCYGLAEATLFVTGGRVGEPPRIGDFDAAALERHEVTEGDSRRLVSSGRSSEQLLVIVDPESGTELPEERVGEIWVSGPSVALGYWKRPEVTEREMRAVLTGETANKSEIPRFLRTGDLGFLRDGELFVTGRLKDLIIIRGRNHYPQDLELTAERAHPDLRPGNAAAFAVDFMGNEAGEERLILALEVERRVRGDREVLAEVAEAVRRAVAEEHEVQVAEVVLLKPGSLPKTSSGKVQRHACRAGYLEGTLEVVGTSAVGEAREAWPVEEVEPDGSLLAFLADRVAALAGLGGRRPDPDVPLTALGLDSLAAVELKASVEEGLGVEVSLADLLEGCSLRELASLVGAGSGVWGNGKPALGGGRLDEQGGLPTPRAPEPAPTRSEALSVGQEALWFIERLAPSGGAYNIVVAARVSGELDAAALLRAAERLTLRHDVLRTTFHEVDGAPMRRIGQEPAVDWREMTGDDAELATEAWAPFDLENGPLLRVRLFRQADGERVLLLAIHHLVADFQSLAVLHRELDALYGEETGGPAAGLPEARSDSEFVRWQRGMLAGPRGAELEEFWRQRLAGPPADLELPADRPRPPVQTFRGGLRSLTIPPGSVERIAALGRARGATLFATLLAIWQAQLGRESGQEDFAIGAPTLGRGSLPGMADVVGYFVSPVALRSELAGDPPFSALLERVRRSTAAALAHADYPLATLAEKLRPVRDPSRSPLFQAMLVLHAVRPGDGPALGAFALGEPGARLKLGSATLEALRLPEHRAQFDLTLRVAPVSGGRLGLLLEFNADLFDGATAERLLGHFQALLEGAAAAPEARVSELPLLTESERRQILGDWAATGAVSLRHAALHEPFFERAEREPDAVALIAGEERLTCRELAERARQLARFLRRHGVGPEARVGVCLRRTPDLIVALLGVLESGGAYVPLDPAYPPERLRFSLEDSGAGWLIAEDPPLPWPLPRGAGEGNPHPLSPALCLSSLHRLSPLSRSAGEGPGEGAPLRGGRAGEATSPENLAYLIYTSGSTGRPKGVAIEHRNALALIEQARRLFTPEELSGVLASTSVCFDLSVFEIFVPLALGGRVILAENALALPGLPAVGEVTLVNTVPSAMAELVRGARLPPSVRAVVLAGEPLSGELARSIHQAGPVRLFNLYGPSEDTTYSTGAVIEKDADRPSIGRPLAGTRAHVLDAAGSPVPAGVPGELLLGGAGLARGYLGRPELTAERFVPDPFNGPGERLYRTGDLVRWKASGDLDFLGRIDHQVKIRGFRVEPGEIEAVLREQPGVRDVAVVVQRGGVAGPRLAAFVVPEETAEEPGVWRRALRERLPEFMIPASWEVLPELPRTPNGKVDRRVLAGRVARPEPSTGTVPATPSEELLAGLWAEVLGLERVGRDAHFFELGGHSLLAVRLLARVRSVLGADLPLEELFRAPTPAALAERLRARGEGMDREPIPRRPRTAGAPPPPASTAQERFWMLERLAPGEPTYHLPGTVRLRGRLDVAALASALSAVVARHEALRTVFREAPDLVQVILPASSMPLPEVDLSALPVEAREAEARRVAAVEARRPFDLAAGPLLRTGLARLGPEERLLWLVLHHAAGDGGSLGILVREVAALYRSAGLPELPIQVADLAVWERERLQGERLAALLAFWRERLAGVSPLELPYDRPRPAVPSLRGGTIPLSLPHLDALARRSGTTRFMVLLAGLDALLARITGQTDVTVGVPVSLRTRVETEGLIGPLINTLAVRVSCAGDPAISELLSRVRRATLEAHAHQELPFEWLESSFLQTMLAPQDTALALDLPGIEAAPVPVDTGTAKLDLTLLADEREPSARLEYSADLFDAGTAARLAGSLETLLAGLAVAGEGTRLSDLPLLNDAERHQILATWNDTAAPFPAESCVHHLFEQQAARTPEAVAVEQEGRSWTYRELDRRAGGLAHRLRSAGAGPGTIVGLCTERSPEMVAGVLGILKAGAAYLPLEPEAGQPAERLAFLIDDAQAALVLGSRSGLAFLQQPGALQVPSILLDEVGFEEAPAPLPDPSPDSLAYVLYTSGSTGRPKGVMVPHRGVVNYLSWAVAAYLRPGSLDAPLHSPLGADLSVTSLFAPLLAGGTVKLLPSGTGVEVLVEAVRVGSFGLLKLTPAHLDLLGHALADRELTGHAGTLVIGGEALQGESLALWRENAPATLVVNEYGPTEAVVGCAVHAAAAGELPAGPVPIGRPIANARLYAVDPWMQPVGVGIAGELLIGGEGVARGYLGRPDLTAERFVPDAFGGFGGRLYRTGDLVRFRADGILVFLGRNDLQVKLRGHRIEPGEIEAALLEHPAVRQAAVGARGTGEERHLVAWVVLAEGAGEDELRSFLGRRLPAFMVPAFFVPLPELPLSPNGKVDRGLLPAPGKPRRDLANFDPPRTVEEEVLAEVWAELLHRERIGRQDRFTELGGSSLQAVRAAARISRTLGVQLPVSALLQEPLAVLASRLDRRARVHPVVPVPRGGDLPVSAAQSRMWFLDRLHPGTAAYNLAGEVRLRGRLEPGALAAALEGVVRRHEALRTAFPERPEGPVQEIRAAAGVPLPVIDLSHLLDSTAEADRLVAAEARRPFDLTHPPLLRATLLRLGAEEHRLALVLHHIVADGWSLGLLLRELGASYGSEELPEPPPLQLADFAVAEREWIAAGRLAEQEIFWRERLAGDLPALDLPTDFLRPRKVGFRGLARTRVLPAELAASLEQAGRGRGATLFMTLLAGFAVLLSRTASQEDLVIGAPVANRNHPDSQGVIGCFVNTLPLRLDLAGSPSFAELLDRVRAVCLAAYARQELPLERIVEIVRPAGRETGRSPLFQALLVLDEEALVPRFRGLETRLARLDTGTAKLDLALHITPRAAERSAAGLGLVLEAAADLFRTETAERLLGHFQALLAGAVTDPGARLSDLPLLTAEERVQIVEEWNATGSLPLRQSFHHEGLHEPFLERAARDPGAEVLIAGEERRTAGELAARVHRLARLLRELGVEPEARVAVCLRREPDLIASLLAVLAAGGAYVPLDPAYPRERLSFYLKDSGARWLIVDADTAGLVDAASCQEIHLDRDAGEIALRSAAPLASVSTPDHLAYLIYTSGSTGRPKGVAIEHRSALALIEWARGFFPPAELAGMLAATSICFDLSVFEIFVPLSLGGRVILAENALALPDLPAASGVTFINTVPSAMAELLRGRSVPPSVRVVALAGEPLPGDLARRIHALRGLGRLLNLYGPSEDTTYSTWAEIGSGEPRPPIGRPVAGTRAWVLDAAGGLVPVGVPGELFLAGAGLARGYLGRPELTAERFVPDPFGEPGERLYRTGDLVRYRPDGSLDFLGRTDHQVKIRGFRIELGEIEARLAGHPEVAEAVVLARVDPQAGARLAAWVVPRSGSGLPRALRAWLRERLPEHMVPSLWTALPALPRTANGKVDRRALPAPAALTAATSREASAQGPLEEVLASLFAEVLGLGSLRQGEAVGGEVSFFDAGGHSLLVTRLVARIRQTLGVDLPLSAVFQAPTVTGLARRVEEALSHGAAERPGPIPRIPRTEDLPASFAQERLWFLDQLEPGEATYHMPAAVRLRGPLNVAALHGALSGAVLRHEALRTLFEATPDGPVQVILPPAPVPLPEIDLSALAVDLFGAEALRLAEAEARRPFDLATGPLLRAALVRLAGDEHLLLFNLHHIAADGGSMAVLLRDVGALYRAALTGGDPGLPALPIQYADFAVWQRERMRRERLAALLAFWRGQLAGAPPAIELPADRPVPAERTRRGGTVPFALSEELSRELDTLARRRGATRFMVLLAGLEALLARLSGQSDLVVGIPFSGRTRIETEELVGLFVNTLPLRVDCGGCLTALDLMGRVRRALLEAHTHQELPFEQLVNALRPERDLGRSPLFQVMLAPRGAELSLDLPGVEAEPLPVDTGTARFDLTFLLGEETPVAGTLEYSADLFDAATAARLAGWWRTLLEGLAAAGEEDLLADLPLLDAAERSQLLATGDGGPRPVEEDVGLHELFARQAAASPDAVALVHGELQVTYGELAARAAQLAKVLRGLGVGPEVPVGVCAQRTPDLIAALLGVLAAGGCYLPLDPGYPPERLALMLEDSGAPVVLLEEELRDRLPGDAARFVFLESVGHVADDRAAALPRGMVLPGNLAYLIYTSGSTGRPKGVAIEHRSALALVRWARGVFAPEELAGVLASTSVCFDLSVFEIFVPLSLGGRVILAENVMELPTLPAASEVTLVNTVPSAMAVLVAMDGLPPSVRTVNLAGEPLPRQLVRALHAAGVERVLDLYGPSEDTTYSTFAQINPAAAGAPEIGRPIEGTRGYVVDAASHLLPSGVPGELLLGGAGLARGYLGRPDLTAERFVPDPYSGDPGSRLYRTGDLVRWRPACLKPAALDFLGRIDHQVKVRGFRIELGEIEAVLSRHPKVRQAAVVARGEGEDRRLIAYVAAGDGSAESGRHVSEALYTDMDMSLPASMVPAALVVLESLPLTPNGKVDRRALPAPEAPRRGTDVFVPPRTSTEEMVAEIWAEVLGIERVGLGRSFFDLGGHSLRAAAVVARIRERFGLNVPLRELFVASTVEGVAARIEEELLTRASDDQLDELLALLDAEEDGAGGG